MKIAYFDCIGGASGDMLLGALVDAGLPLESLRERLLALHLTDEFELRAQKVQKNGFSATKVDVAVREPPRGEHHPGRHLAEIESVLIQSSLPESIKARASGMFRRLAEVEAGIHNQPVERIHLHEVGGVDTIVDVVGMLIGLEILAVERVMASPLPLGRGFVTGAHGQIPLPAPAALALLKGVPIRGSEIDMELVTPTGALLLTSLCSAFGPIPDMNLLQVGYGAGGRDLPIPNLVRLLLGEQLSDQGLTTEALWMLETNIDDNTAEVDGYVMEQLFAAGALDVFFSSIQMKKNRPATMISVLCHPVEVEALEAVLFRETSTLGIRRQWVERHCLGREIERVETPYGTVRVKVARLPDGSTKRAPEYEDCKAAAASLKVPLREVYQAALRVLDGR